MPSLLSLKPAFLSLWNPSFPLHTPALISLSLAKVQLSFTLTLYPLTTWCFGQKAPFLLAKVALVYMPTALSVALRPFFPFQQAQYAQVFSLKPPPFCTLFADFGSTNKSATSLLFFTYLTLALSSPPCPLFHLSFYHNLFGRSGRNCLFSPVLSGYNWSRTLVSPRERRGWPDRERYSCPMKSLVVSLLSSLISTLLFFRTEGVLCHQNSSTPRFPRLCSLVTLAVFSLVFAKTDTAFC